MWLTQSTTAVSQYAKAMLDLGCHCVFYLCKLKKLADTAYEYLKIHKEECEFEEPQIDISKLVEEIVWNHTKDINVINKLAFDMYYRIFVNEKEYKCNIIKKQDERALECDPKREQDGEFQISFGKGHELPSEPPVYIDHKLIEGNNHQIWNISKWNSAKERSGVKIISGLDKKSRLGVYIYKTYTMNRAMTREVKYFKNHVFFNNPEFEVVGVRASSEKEFDERSEWEIFLTGDKDYILLKSCKTQKALDGNADLKSSKIIIHLPGDGRKLLERRQVYADVSLDRNNDFQKWRIQAVE